MKLVSYLDMREPKKGSGKARRWALFKCKCGKSVERDADAGLKAKSCGCKWLQSRTKHGGVEGGKKSPLYKVWDGMKQRCMNPNSASYPLYGGRGINVCARWQVCFESFRAWALSHGYIPHETELDRIDTDGDYKPRNCRFVTPAINSANRRYVKLNNAIPGIIRILIAQGFKQRDIYLFAHSKLQRGTISQIATGKIWKPAGLAERLQGVKLEGEAQSNV